MGAALIGVLMMATVTLSPADKEADRHAWAMMQRAKPDVDWDKGTLRRADLTGEGERERSRVMVGRDDAQQLFVAVTRPGREGPTNPQVFALGRPQSLGLSFFKLEKPEDCLADDGTPLEGCRPRKGKSGLLFMVDSKPSRVYWVGTEKRFMTSPKAEAADHSAPRDAPLQPGQHFAGEAAPERDDADHEDHADDHRDP